MVPGLGPAMRSVNGHAMALLTQHLRAARALVPAGAPDCVWPLTAAPVAGGVAAHTGNAFADAGAGDSLAGELARRARPYVRACVMVVQCGPRPFDICKPVCRYRLRSPALALSGEGDEWSCVVRLSQELCRCAHVDTYFRVRAVLDICVSECRAPQRAVPGPGAGAVHGRRPLAVEPVRARACEYAFPIAAAHSTYACPHARARYDIGFPIARSYSTYAYSYARPRVPVATPIRHMQTRMRSYLVDILRLKTSILKVSGRQRMIGELGFDDECIYRALGDAAKVYNSVLARLAVYARA